MKLNTSAENSRTSLIFLVGNREWRVNGVWGKEQGVSKRIQVVSPYSYCLVLPSRRRTDRVLFTRKRVLWPRFWHGVGAKYAGGDRARPVYGLSACGTNFFFLVVTRPISRRHAVKIAGALESLTTCHLLGTVRYLFREYRHMVWYVMSKLPMKNLYSKPLNWMHYVVILNCFRYANRLKYMCFIK